MFFFKFSLHSFDASAADNVIFKVEPVALETLYDRNTLHQGQISARTFLPFNSRYEIAGFPPASTNALPKPLVVGNLGLRFAGVLSCCRRIRDFDSIRDT